MSGRRSFLMYDLGIIGGGLIGLSIALEAAREGMKVVVLEADVLGRHASAASAGGVRSLNRHPAEIPLARAALPLWQEASARLGRDVGFVASGQIRVALDKAGMEALEARAARTAALGYDHERLIGSEALADREPALLGRAVGALVVDDDGFANPLASLNAYAAAARATGVTVREGTRVKDIQPSPSGVILALEEGEVTARQAVIAAGAWGAEFAQRLGDPVEVTPRALQMTVTERLPRFARATIGIEGRKLSLKQGAEGTVVIGGAYQSPICADEIGRPKLADVAANLGNAAEIFPHLKSARVVRSWAGIEGMSADGLPVLGPSPKARDVVHAFGFSAHGFALAPLVGPIVRDMLMGKDTNLPLHAFRPERFSTTGTAQT